MNPMQRPTDRLTIFLFRQVKKVPCRKYEKGRSRLMCSYAQSDKSYFIYCAYLQGLTFFMYNISGFIILSSLRSRSGCD